MENSDCIFCKILRKEIPAPLVYEDEWAVCFRDINPQAPIHLLVIPREHIAHLHDFPDGSGERIAGLFGAVRAVITREKLDTAGYRLVVNSGEISGQAVFHIHVHILSGRPMKWPPG